MGLIAAATARGVGSARAALILAGSPSAPISIAW